MAESGSDEKTEAPSQKRRDDAREEGQVAYSKEVSSAASLGGFLLLFYFGAGKMLDAYRESFLFAFSNLNLAELDYGILTTLVGMFFKQSSVLVAPFFLTAILVGVFSSVMQVGLKLSLKPIMPSLKKLNPASGLARIFSKQAFSELIKSLFKMAVIGYIGYYTFIEFLPDMANLVDRDPMAMFTSVGEIIGTFAFRLFLAMAVMAVFDFMFQRWDLEQKLKMSLQDIKEEMKQSEGDPQLKAKIRSIQQQMSQARMMQEVPKADVVVTNPTHFAIAMLYDRENMSAPQVVAKGADHMARRIIEVAKQNGVTVFENPQVARGLYFQVEIGDSIPEFFYKAVAEILAFVYKAKKKKRR